MNLPAWSADPTFAVMLTEAPDLAATWLVDEVEPAPSLCELLLWYAGDADAGWLRPTWEEDEAARAVLAAWLAFIEPDHREPPPPRVKPSKAQRTAWPLRWQAVRDMEPTRETVMEPPPLSVPLVRKLRLVQKRGVLRLFPEVKAKRSLAIADDVLQSVWTNRHDFIRDRQREQGFRLDRPVQSNEGERRSGHLVFEQTLAAPDWIPPEPQGLRISQADRFSDCIAHEVIRFGDLVAPTDAGSVRVAEAGGHIGMAMSNAARGDIVRVQLNSI